MDRESRVNLVVEQVRQISELPGCPQLRFNIGDLLLLVEELGDYRVRVEVQGEIISQFLAQVGNLLPPLRNGASIYDEEVARPLARLVRIMESARPEQVDLAVAIKALEV